MMNLCSEMLSFNVLLYQIVYLVVLRIFFGPLCFISDIKKLAFRAV